MKKHLLHLSIPLLFLLVALASTWPLARFSGSHLPMGMESAATVPLFNVWTVWWNADRAANGFHHYWDAPIFYPTSHTFAFSEPMPLSILAAPVIWITGSRILAYNTLILLSLWLNGWMAYLLLRRLYFARWTATIGAAAMELLPLVHSWLGVIQLVPVFGIIWTITIWLQFLKQPGLKTGFILGIAYAVTYLMCASFGLFLLLLLPVSSLWLMERQIARYPTWAALLTAAIVAGVLCLPVVSTQQQAFEENDFHRPMHYIAQLSAQTENYGIPPWTPLIPLGPANAAKEEAGFKLGPGWIKIALMLAGIVLGFRWRRHRRWTLFCLTLLTMAFLFSLGPNLQAMGYRPYVLLIKIVPGLAQIRNVFRFAVFVQIAVVLLATTGLQIGGVFIRRYIHHTGWRRTACWLLIAAGITAAIEIWPPHQPLYSVPSQATHKGWLQWLETQTARDSVVVCLPFAFKPDVISYEQEAQWVYWGTFHHRAMVNGYSSFFPATFVSMKWSMAEFPSLQTIQLLKKTGVNYCVIQRDSYYGEETYLYAGRNSQIEFVYADSRAGIDIYKIQ